MHNNHQRHNEIMEENNNINNIEKTPYEEPKIEVVETPIQQEESTTPHSQDDEAPQPPANQTTDPTPEEPPREEPQKPVGGEPTGEEQNSVKAKDIKEELEPATKRKGSFIESLSELVKNTAMLTRALVGLAIVAVLLAGGIYFLKQKAKQREMASLRISQAITKVEKIQDFCTAKYYEEIVISDSHNKGELVIIYKGLLRVGFKLEKMTTDKITDTSIVVNLPVPEILETITNFKDREVFAESGKWDKNSLATFTKRAQDTIRKHAYEDCIFQLAIDSGKERMTKLFKSIGFKSVTVNVAEPEPIEIEINTPIGIKTMKINPLTGKIVK